MTDIHLQPGHPESVKIGDQPIDTAITGPLDSISGSLETISYAHHEVHEGDAYKVEVNDIDLDNNNEISIAFKTPATGPWCHIFPIAATSGESRFECLEAPTITAESGSTKAIINRNRNSLNVSAVVDNDAAASLATINGTITGDGTVICDEVMGEGKNKSGGQSRDQAEIILKADTLYAFRITALQNDN
ncbi:MAG: hypothetical protein GY869_09805, partial [Planctomycetes bacterium]|nr:hypothetical protein [Planctomycetota bacterium]